MRHYVCLHRQEKRYWKNRKAYKKSRHQCPIRRAIEKKPKHKGREFDI